MERLVPSEANGMADPPLGAQGTPDPILRLQRTWGVWQIPELDGPDAEALLELWPPGSFLVIGHPPSQFLVLKTGLLPENCNTYQILRLPGGVSLESSNLCMPNLPHLLAFLSASRDVLPRTLLLPPHAPGPGSQDRDLLQRASVHTSERGISVVNRLYLEAHHEWEVDRISPDMPPDTTERPAPRHSSPHRVSWVEGPLSPEEPLSGPALPCLAEEKEEEEEDSDNLLIRHIRALVRARSSYVARQFRSFRARLTSETVGPHRPGDPATELLQDVRHLLTDLQEHLAKDPDVRAVFGSRGSGDTQNEEDFDSAVEAALCWAVLEPLKPPLWMRLRTLRAQELKHLQKRQLALREGTCPLGAQGAWPERQGPAPALRSRIHARLTHLHDACSPRRKVALLLAICSDVYKGLACSENPEQEPLGADAFLPALTEELIWSPNIGETQLDVEFLMELLDPDQLRGEAGYYLTTWFGALHHIAHYEPEGSPEECRSPRKLSIEARDSLRQWHRRRTLHGQGPAEAQDELPFEEPWTTETVPGDQ